MTLLDVRDLTVRYRSSLAPAVTGVAFALAPGESLGIFGKSGSGKTTLARALLGLGSRDDRVISGSIRFRDVEIVGLTGSRLQKLRGRHITLIGQEPELALNPVLTVGRQMVEVLRTHVPGDLPSQRRQAESMLARVGLDPSEFFNAYPHQLSGGQRQRVIIAQALACKPALLIADEPTSALDVRTQGEILALLQTLKNDLQLSLILISHNLQLLGRATDRLASMNEGVLAETPVPRSAVAAVSNAVAHNIRSADLSAQSFSECSTPEMTPVLEARGVFKTYVRGQYFSGGRSQVAALSGVDFRLPRGQTVAIIGESGSGKTTLARCLARVEDPDSGEICFEGRDVTHLPKPQLACVRRRIQLVFQHSATAMNPHYSAEEIVGEPLLIRGGVSKRERREIVLSYMEQVGLCPEWAKRRAGQFSGGQRQRLAIARAMILNPDVMIFDEALSGLDATTSAGILELLLRYQASGSKSYAFITHDLQIARDLSGSVVAMQDGKITESTIFSNPSFPGAGIGQSMSSSHA